MQKETIKGSLSNGYDNGYGNGNLRNTLPLHITHNDNKVAKRKHVHDIAMKLVKTFNGEAYWKFYCKVAWTLPESVIWHIVEEAKGGNNPGSLFTFLAKEELYDYE